MRLYKNKIIVDDVESSLNIAISDATTTISGLMSPTDKAKLDGIAEGANNITVDSALSSTSTNPVQNSVITNAIDEIKKSVSNGKSLVANAITQKGVSTASDATFATMATNIGSIKTESVLTGNATLQDVLQGKTFYNTNAMEKQTGTMNDNNASWYETTAKYGVGSNGWIGLDIPKTGKYYDTSYLYRYAKDLELGDATVDKVLSEITFTSKNGVKVTGTMTNRGAVSASVAVGGSYTIPAGYHNGSGKVTGPTLSGNATAADVASGKTFYSNSGTKQTGTLSLNFPSGYKLMTGSKDWESTNLAANGIIPIYLYWYCAGTQWTSFPSDVYVKDNNDKIYGSCHVNGNSSGSGSGYKSIWELYNGNWDSMKTITTFSITGSQSPNGSVSIKVWLQKV